MRSCPADLTTRRSKIHTLRRAVIQPPEIFAQWRRQRVLNFCIDFPCSLVVADIRFQHVVARLTLTLCCQFVGRVQFGQRNETTFFWDRLVTELRLSGASSIEEAKGKLKQHGEIPATHFPVAARCATPKLSLVNSGGTGRPARPTIITA